MRLIRNAFVSATLASLFLPAFVYADSVGTPGVNTGGEYKCIKKYTKDPSCPHMPGKDYYISVNIENGVLAIEFPADTEMAVVNIGTGDFAVFSAGIDRGYPCVELPPLSGDFLLSVTFDNGDTYEGEISFN